MLDQLLWGVLVEAHLFTMTVVSARILVTDCIIRLKKVPLSVLCDRVGYTVLARGACPVSRLTFLVMA